MTTTNELTGTDRSMELEQAIIDADPKEIYRGAAYRVKAFVGDDWRGVYCGDCLTLANWMTMNACGESIAADRITELTSSNLNSEIGNTIGRCEGCDEKFRELTVDEQIKERMNEWHEVVALHMTRGELRALRAVVQDYKTGNSRAKKQNVTTAWLVIRPSKEIPVKSAAPLAVVRNAEGIRGSVVRIDLDSMTMEERAERIRLADAGL